MSNENGARVLQKTMSENASGNHHVHFPEADAFPENDDIQVVASGDDSFTIHLGFLQHLHRYSLAFFLPAANITPELETCDQGVPNLNCKLLSAEKVDKGLNLTFEFFAHKDKLLKEKITLQDKGTEGKLLHLEFSARVLGQSEVQTSCNSI
jgi:hypothetical protein